MKTTESDMKTIVNKLRFALLLSFVAIGLTVLAQEIANIEKMSISTQMFLDELAGKYNFDRPQSSIKSSDGSIVDSSIRQHGRHIAHSENINGQDYISSFIFVSKNDDISIIESLGVIIENCFSDTLVTALIPVDKIQDLAAFDGVKRIEVATIMETATDNARLCPMMQYWQACNNNMMAVVSSLVLLISVSIFNISPLKIKTAIHALRECIAAPRQIHQTIIGQVVAHFQLPITVRRIMVHTRVRLPVVLA